MKVQKALILDFDYHEYVTVILQWNNGFKKFISRIISAMCRWKEAQHYGSGYVTVQASASETKDWQDSRESEPLGQNWKSLLIYISEDGFAP